MWLERPWPAEELRDGVGRLEPAAWHLGLCEATELFQQSRGSERAKASKTKRQQNQTPLAVEEKSERRHEQAAVWAKDGDQFGGNDDRVKRLTIRSIR